MDTVVATATEEPKGRARGPGPSGVRTLVVVAVFALLFAALGYGIDTMAAAGSAPGAPRHQIERTSLGTPAHPALTVEGDRILVRAPGFSALALVNGPVVPGEGLPVQTRFTTCTWTVSISDVEGTLPLSVADFNAIDHFQTLYEPALLPGAPPLPAELTSGQHLTFKMRAVMPVGEGLLRWAPDGEHIVAKWDYQVEND